jgi:hypothetical protein
MSNWYNVRRFGLTQTKASGQTDKLKCLTRQRLERYCFNVSSV